MGIPLKEDRDTPGYLHTFDLDGTKAFALWPLIQRRRSGRQHGRRICLCRRPGSSLKCLSGAARSEARTRAAGRAKPGLLIRTRGVLGRSRRYPPVL